MNLHPVVIVLAILLLCGSQQGCSAKADEEIAADAEREAYDKKITYRLPDGRIFEADLPIEYTAKVTQCNTNDGCKTRYYQPRQR